MVKEEVTTSSGDLFRALRLKASAFITSGAM